MEKEQIKTKIKAFLCNNLNADVKDLTDTAHLFDEGIIDSLEVPKILTFLEKEFMIKIDDNYFFDDRFFFIEGIASIIQEIKQNR